MPVLLLFTNAAAVGENKKQSFEDGTYMPQ